MLGHINIMRKYVLLILPLFLFACKEKQRQEGDYGFPKGYDLVAKLADDELFAKSPEIRAIDDRLLITASYSDMHTEIIKIHDVNNGFRVVGSYGSRGRGPKEFLQPLLITTEGHRVFFANVNRSEIIEIDVSEDGSKMTEIERKEFNYDKKSLEKLPQELNLVRAEPQNIIKLKSGYWAGVSSFDSDNFYSFWDENLNFISSFGNAPVAHEVDYISGLQWLGGHTASLGDEFVFVGYYLPYLAMYEVVDGKPKKKWDKYFLEPRFKVFDGSFVFSGKHFGVDVDVAMGRDYIYIAFMGVYAEELNDPKLSMLANQIFVFDHDGKPVACLNLDHRVHSIALSPDEKTLYAVAVMPEYRIAEYELPNFEQ